MATTATADPAKSTEKDAELEKKESIAMRLVCSEFMFVTAVAMVIPTRAPLVLGIKNNDAVATARVLGLMSSTAAFIELFINPVFGQLSDMFGRKPFFIIPPLIDAFLHLGVAAFPKALRVNFVDRMISGSMIYAFKAPLSASLSDLFTGPRLAVWLARQGSAFGLGLGLGPYIGAKIGGARSFFWSAMAFLAAMALAMTAVPETLPVEQRKKEFNLAACSPLRFLKLFHGRVLSTLTATVGLQSFGDYLNVYDINYLFLKTVFDVGQTEIGRYASACGVALFTAGPIMTRAISTAGQKTATLGANVMWAVAMGLLGGAQSVQQVVASLFAMCFGAQRNAAVAAYIQKHGQDSGMGKAEISAAQANFLAVLKVCIPLIYGNVFAFATSGGRKVPGAPYFIIAALTALAQCCFWTCDPEK